MRKIIKITTLLQLASALKSEDGENPEYDRALAELCTDACGLPMEDKYEMAVKLGIKME